MGVSSIRRTSSARLKALRTEIGPSFHLHFGSEEIKSSRDIKGEHRDAENEFYLHLLRHGVIIPGLHLAFLSYAHSPEDVDHVIEAFKQSFRDIRAKGLV